jgi:hypothetical protein
VIAGVGRHRARPTRWQRTKTVALVVFAPIFIVGCLLMGVQKIVDDTVCNGHSMTAADYCEVGNKNSEIYRPGPHKEVPSNARNLAQQRSFNDKAGPIYTGIAVLFGLGAGIMAYQNVQGRRRRSWTASQSAKAGGTHAAH